MSQTTDSAVGAMAALSSKINKTSKTSKLDVLSDVTKTGTGKIMSVCCLVFMTLVVTIAVIYYVFCYDGACNVAERLTGARPVFLFTGELCS